MSWKLLSRPCASEPRRMVRIASNADGRLAGGGSSASRTALSASVSKVALRRVQRTRLTELLAGVDVAECIGLVVEPDLDHAQRGVPRVDLPATAVEEGREMRQHIAAHETEHRMRLIEGSRHSQLGVGLREAGGEPRH